jgi:Histidinol-phosphate/aromatic aminotransferase and cobyric acid decarboxylase
MAGLRCGYAVGQTETIAQLRAHQSWDSVNIMAVAAASASLEDANQVASGRRLNQETRTFVTTQLEAMGYNSIPSQANFIMFDVKRPVVPLIKALKDKNVAVGRLFPALPNHMRLTIGKKNEMEAFLSAFVSGGVTFESSLRCPHFIPLPLGEEDAQRQVRNVSTL